MCVVVMGLTGVQAKTLPPVRQQMNERRSSGQCSALELMQASTYSSISGVKDTSLIFLTGQYAGKTNPERKTQLGRRPTKVTACEQPL